MLRKHQHGSRRNVIAVAVTGLALASPPALADVGARLPSASPPRAEETTTEAPPPQALRYLQYGVAFTVEVAGPGDFCSDPYCVLGSGGGIAGHLGWRSAGQWYFGLALEVSKQDPTKLLQLAFLKQVRVEARRYLDMTKDTQPFIALGAGIAGYGDEWDISAYGPTAFVGMGIETQVSSTVVVSATLGYRPMFLTQLSPWSSQLRAGARAHVRAGARRGRKGSALRSRRLDGGGALMSHSTA